MQLSIKKIEDGIQFPASIQPRSSRNEICGLHQDTLKIKLTAPPVEGAANQMCLKFLAKAFGIRPARISIVSGASSRHKVIRVEGMDESTFRNLLASHLTGCRS